MVAELSSNQGCNQPLKVLKLLDGTIFSFHDVFKEIFNFARLLICDTEAFLDLLIEAGGVR